MKYLLLIALSVSLFACNKDSDTPDPVDPVKPEDKEKATALTEFLKNEKLRLSKYYSETPIDYIDTDDVVMQETDLWNYVSNWLKDDSYDFNPSGIVTIEQNVNRIATDTSAVLTREYAVF